MAKGSSYLNLPLPSSLSKKRGALCAVSLIKEKRSCELKGQTCVDGSVEPILSDKSETTSPSVANDVLLYTILIDTKERRRDVATADASEHT
jgi:hypothetical protein